MTEKWHARLPAARGPSGARRGPGRDPGTPQIALNDRIERSPSVDSPVAREVAVRVHSVAVVADGLDGGAWPFEVEVFDQLARLVEAASRWQQLATEVSDPRVLGLVADIVIMAGAKSAARQDPATIGDASDAARKWAMTRKGPGRTDPGSSQAIVPNDQSQRTPSVNGIGDGALVVRLPVSLRDAPGFREAGPLGLAMRVAGVVWSAHHGTRGYLPAAGVEELLVWQGIAWRCWMGEVCGGREDAEALDVADHLVDVGLWAHAARGYHIIAFDEAAS